MDMKSVWNELNKIKDLEINALIVNALQEQAERKKPLTIEQLKTINADLENRRWVWIKALKPFDYEYKVSAYYQS